jgi:hypothetical protein
MLASAVIKRGTDHNFHGCDDHATRAGKVKCKKSGGACEPGKPGKECCEGLVCEPPKSGKGPGKCVASSPGVCCPDACFFCSLYCS